jgi:hypothetical protein
LSLAGKASRFIKNQEFKTTDLGKRDKYEYLRKKEKPRTSERGIKTNIPGRGMNHEPHEPHERKTGFPEPCPLDLNHGSAPFLSVVHG